jgi:undecaprenyl-diphosphatase
MDSSAAERGGSAPVGRSRPFPLAHRSRSNFLRTVAIVRARFSSRPARYSSRGWPGALGLAALTVLVAWVLLDAPADAYRGEWPRWLRLLARNVTDIGLSGWYIAPAVAVLLAANLADWEKVSRRMLLVLYNWTSLAFFVLVSVGLSGLAATTLKRVIGRARPYLDEGILSFDPFTASAAHASFPSGHSTTMGAVTALLFLFLPGARFIIVPLGIFLAATRILVGAHFPSDVVAGLAFGFAFTIGAALLFARLGFVFRQKTAGIPEPRRTFRLLPRRR